MTRPTGRSPLALKPGRLLLLNPPGRPDELIGPLPADLKVTARGKADAAVAFVRSKAEAHRSIAAVLKAIPDDGLLWLCYPKGGSGVETDLNRDILWNEMKQYGIRPVTVRSLGSTWTAMRFRPVGKVKTG